MYVAVKGGEKAILNSHRLLAEERRGSLTVPELELKQIEEQLSLAVDRVMMEGSLYDRELSALAIKQARGDLLEAIFLLRAYRTTLPRLGISQPLDTSVMHIQRRISAIFKDLPGGQVLGPTFDYTHRLLDFSLAAGGSGFEAKAPVPAASEPREEKMPRAIDFLAEESLIQGDPQESEIRPLNDLTRQPLEFPAERDIRLQNLARGDEGFLLGLAYSVQRGFGKSHPFVGEIRSGQVSVAIIPEELGFPVEIGEITVTECHMVNQFVGSATDPPMFTRGYGLTFGQSERKAMAMSLVDRALRCRELGEEAESPAQDEEFVLYHSDNVEASGFLQHLKLPHYVDFQSELTLLRDLQAKWERRKENNPGRGELDVEKIQETAGIEAQKLEGV